MNTAEFAILFNINFKIFFLELHQADGLCLYHTVFQEPHRKTLVHSRRVRKLAQQFRRNKRLPLLHYGGLE